jgi:probable rRNA maturation factor
MSGVTLDIQIEDTSWAALKNIEALCQKAIDQACLEAKPKPMKGAELSILFTNDAAIQALNKQWRNIDKPTNILSFPAVPPNRIAKSPLLGDLALGFETIQSEAITDEKTLENHLTHLIIHGFLHILGYDHETDAEADIMEALEISILAKLNISDPYADCDLLETKS